MKITNLRYIILTILFLLSSHISYSQFKVSGNIKDKGTGETLSFANIEYNGKKAISDINGNFSFSVKDQNLNLIISYIGYKTKAFKLKLDENENILKTIFLHEDFTTLDDVTITSGKYKKSIADVTVSIESLKPKFIEKNNTTDVADLLEKIPGVNYVDGQANIRGGSGFSYGAGSRVMVLIDNIPALQFDSGYPNWENIPVETISKIEVMKGAGSALYGSAAMNGVINILPIYAKKKMKLKLKAFYSYYDSPADTAKQWWDSAPNKYGFSGLFAKKIKKLDVVASVYYQEFKSYKQYCFNNYGRATLDLNYHLNDALNFGIKTNLNSGKKLNFFYWKNSTKGAYQADTSAYAGQDKTVFIIDPYINYFSKNGAKHRFQSRIYAVSNTVSGSKSNNSISKYGEYQYQKKISQYSLTMTGGISGTISNTTAELYGDTSYVAKNYGIYIQIEKKFFKRLSLVGGARYERNTISGPKIIQGIDIRDKYKPEGEPVFRLGLNYKLFSHTNFRASWGQGFRYPTIAEKFTNTFSGALLIFPNPDLQSERGQTIELGIRQGFKFSNFKGFADFSVFQSKYYDMIEFHIKSKNKKIFFIADNIGDTDIKGFEFTMGLTGKIRDLEIGLMGGYLYTDPKYQNFTLDIERNSSVDYNILKYRYKKSIKFDFSSTYKNFTLGFGSSYNSFMEAIDKIFELNLFFKGVKDYREKNNQGTNIYRLNIGYKYQMLGLRFNIDNLFNKEYSVRPGLLQAPRSYSLSLLVDI